MLVFVVNFRPVPIIEAPILPVGRKRKSLEQEKDTEQEKKPVSNRVPINPKTYGIFHKAAYIKVTMVDCIH